MSYTIKALAPGRIICKCNVLPLETPMCIMSSFNAIWNNFGGGGNKAQTYQVTNGGTLRSPPATKPTEVWAQSNHSTSRISRHASVAYKLKASFKHETTSVWISLLPHAALGSLESGLTSPVLAYTVRKVLTWLITVLEYKHHWQS